MTVLFVRQETGTEAWRKRGPGDVYKNAEHGHARLRVGKAVQPPVTWSPLKYVLMILPVIFSNPIVHASHMAPHQGASSQFMLLPTILCS